MKLAVVTGAASGIGRACALALTDPDGAVVLLDRDAEGLERTAAAVRRAGGTAFSYALDVTDAGQVSAAFGEIARLGPMSVLVNSAGIEIMKSLEDMTERDWDWQMAVNVKSMFLCCQQGVPSMQAAGGSIINIASVLGILAAPLHTAYCASKGAVIQFTKALGLDLAPRGIRVNAVLPGPIDTPMYRATMATYPDPVNAHEQHVRSIPLGTIGQPEDVAAVVAFLASPASRFVTCTSIVVDGGFTASKVSLS
jgi:NAD(P)-dependent dehydrogenase (short-subunit alcohol dehydrogenase family)